MSKADVLRIPDYLEHIVEGIERIHRYVSDVSEVDFLADEKTQDAVIRNFENIGEAAHNIEHYHSKFADAHPDIPWTVVYAMRNRVAHGYFKVDLEMIWKTIHSDLPELHTDQTTSRRNKVSNLQAKPPASQIIAMESANPYSEATCYITKIKSPASFLTGLGYM